MKQAMISPQEVVSYQTAWNESTVPPTPIYTDGWRVAQVVPDGQTFPMADPVFWTPCADDVEKDSWFYIESTQEIIPVPPYPFPQPKVSAEIPQPISQGTETL